MDFLLRQKSITLKEHATLALCVFSRVVKLFVAGMMFCYVYVCASQYHETLVLVNGLVPLTARHLLPHGREWKSFPIANLMRWWWWMARKISFSRTHPKGSFFFVFCQNNEHQIIFGLAGMTSEFEPYFFVVCYDI